MIHLKKKKNRSQRCRENVGVLKTGLRHGNGGGLGSITPSDPRASSGVGTVTPTLWPEKPSPKKLTFPSAPSLARAKPVLEPGCPLTPRPPPGLACLGCGKPCPPPWASPWQFRALLGFLNLLAGPFTNLWPRVSV